MTPIIPDKMRSIYEDWRMSPGLECGGFVFLTGFNGMALNGEISSNPREQIKEAFAQVDMVLRHGNLSFGDVVEMTSYHVGIRDHLDDFKDIRNSYIKEPYPAWTAIEVAGFVSENVIVELRVIARRA